MSRMLLSTVALLVGLAFTGCMQTMESVLSPAAQIRPDARMQATTASAHGILHLSTSVEVGEHVIATGSSVPLVLSLTNHERVPVYVPALGCAFLYIVYDQQGSQVSDSFTCGYSVEPPITLDAGETVKRNMEWLAVTHHYENGVFFDVPLPPGQYRIHAYMVPGWPLAWDTYLSAPYVVRLVPSTRAGGTSSAQTEHETAGVGAGGAPQVP